MSQTIQKDLMLSYPTFMSTNNFKDADQVEKIYVFNDSVLIFPVLEKDLMPANGIILDIPDWIARFGNLKELYLIGLYISDLNSNLKELKNLEKLKFAIPKNSNIDKIIAKISQFKSLKILDLSDSIIDKNQFKQIEGSLPKIKIIHSNFFK